MFDYGTTIEVSLQIDDGYSFTIDSDDVSLVNKWNGVYAFIMPDKQVTITVTSSAKSYGIHYVLDGWVLPDWVSNPAHYNPTLLTLTLNNPTRTWYKFKWWKDETWRLFYDEDSDTTQIRIQDSPLVDKEYTAQWEAKTYTVKYYVDGTMVWSESVSHNEQADVITHRPTVEEWYYFAGWYLDSDKQDMYTFDGVVSNIDLYGFVNSVFWLLYPS